MLPIDVLGPYPAEIVMSIKKRQRLRALCIAHNVKFNNMSLLNMAILSNDPETVKLVLEEAAQNAKSSPIRDTVIKHATRPLWTKWFSWAVYKNYHEIPRRMLLLGGMTSYLNQEDRYLDKLLLLAIERCRGADMAALLLEHGADPDFYENGDTPIHLAAKVNNKAVIKMLILQYNADANYRGAGGDTPLMEATTHRDMGTAKLFLQSPRHTPLTVCLLKMAGAADMSPCIPLFKKLLIREGIDMGTFRRDYATSASERLEDTRSDFLLELLQKMGFDILTINCSFIPDLKASGSEVSWRFQQGIL
ncbi:hypothetical protein CCMA1212_005958 [Trichoderma ghanense]|uniref:Ankyrin repeat protein n=1 Tax=Trichoderma ghanense TaxID=65468 RepID=A0ABY2H284_9HYPO